jgi:dinuclear metal center YbgI/SA1388 family protein
MIKIKDITNYLEQWAPLAYQEAYDNSGLLLGDLNNLVNGILICLDITEDILKEAKEKNCNLIIAHHPIIFRPIKKLTGSNYVERCVIKAIKQDISIYILHTNLDNIAHGVNQSIAQQLDLKNCQILLPKPNTLQKLIAFLSHSTLNQVNKALYQAGAIHIDNSKYDGFFTNITNTNYTSDELINFSINSGHNQELVDRYKLEATFPAYLNKKIIDALQKAHSYERIVYQIQNLENPNLQVGAGMMGELSQPLESRAFLSYLKEKMGLSSLRHSTCIEKNIKKVALCGGAGIFLLPAALSQGADAFVTADVKYHDFFDADGRILLTDVGHYESEIIIKGLIYSKLSKKFSNIAILQSAIQTNPVHYF